MGGPQLHTLWARVQGLETLEEELTDLLSNVSHSALAPRLSSEVRTSASLDASPVSTASSSGRASHATPRRRRGSASSSESGSQRRFFSVVKKYFSLVYGFPTNTAKHEEGVVASRQSASDNGFRKRVRVLQKELCSGRVALAELMKMLDAQSGTIPSEESVLRVKSMADSLAQLEKRLREQKDEHRELSVAIRLICNARTCVERAMGSCRKDVFRLGLLGVRSAFRTNSDWTEAVQLRDTAMTHLMRFPEIQKIATSENCGPSLRALNIITDSAATDVFILGRLNELKEQLIEIREAMNEVGAAEQEKYRNLLLEIHAARMRLEQGQKDMILEHFSELREENSNSK